MEAGRLSIKHDLGALELHETLLYPGDVIEFAILGKWISGHLARDASGWYLITADAVGIRLREGLIARLPDAEKHQELLPEKPIIARRSEAEEHQKIILLVEDDDIHASMMCQILEEETSYKVVHTSDAHTAWRFLQDITPQLLLLDYWLPGMNGLDLYDRIHADNRLHDVPVLI